MDVIFVLLQLAYRDVITVRPPAAAQIVYGFGLLLVKVAGKMSTAMNFGTKSFRPRAPDKGSFPLDHFGESEPEPGRFRRTSSAALCFVRTAGH